MNEIIKKNGIYFGVVTGILSVLITTIIYVTNLELFTSTWIGLISIALYIGIGVFLLNKTKKELKGQFSFKEAFTTYFISAVIGILISTVFNIILFNFIDPEAKVVIKEITLKYTAQMLQKFGTPSAVVKETLSEMEKVDQFSPMALLKNSIFSTLFSAIFGLILAAIFKSKSTNTL